LVKHNKLFRYLNSHGIEDTFVRDATSETRYKVMMEEVSTLAPGVSVTMCEVQKVVFPSLAFRRQTYKHCATYSHLQDKVGCYDNLVKNYQLSTPGTAAIQ